MAKFTSESPASSCERPPYLYVSGAHASEDAGTGFNGWLPSLLFLYVPTPIAVLIRNAE